MLPSPPPRVCLEERSALCGVYHRCVPSLCTVHQPSNQAAIDMQLTHTLRNTY